jgi:hypothetical protein
MTPRLSSRSSLASRLALALALALATTAQAQTPSSLQAERTRPMSTNLPSVTAFFYQNPVVLDREQHKGLRIKPADARFAAKNQAVPLVVTEFPEASLEYPIVFVKAADGQWLALALTGLTANVNAFIGTNGQWNARYVPASVRRYPFILAEGTDKQLSLAADLSAPQLVRQGKDGEPIFDDKGEPTELTRNLLAMLGDFQTQAQRTHALAEQLDEAKLLNQQNLQVRLNDGRNAVVEGVWIVDEAKLRELPDAKVLAWFRGGELAAVHAHMLSLRNLVPLLERSQPVGTPIPLADNKSGKPVETKAPAAKGKKAT